MLRLTQTVHAEIKKHGAAAYPYEGCGLLLGYVEDGVNVVTAVQPMQNVWPVEAEKPIRFRIAEDDWRDAEIEAMLKGLDVIGVFHSHPDNPPVASPRDRAWAAWTGYSYLITQVDAGQAGISRSWQLKSDRSGFSEEPVTEISLVK